jgi:hypothetical protein
MDAHFEVPPAALLVTQQYTPGVPRPLVNFISCTNQFVIVTGSGTVN